MREKKEEQSVFYLAVLLGVLCEFLARLHLDRMLYVKSLEMANREYVSLEKDMAKVKLMQTHLTMQ
jgi:hypothetical protein